jgi:hypothetical protein
MDGDYLAMLPTPALSYTITTVSESGLPAGMRFPSETE